MLRWVRVLPRLIVTPDRIIQSGPAREPRARPNQLHERSQRIRAPEVAAPVAYGRRAEAVRDPCRVVPGTRGGYRRVSSLQYVGFAEQVLCAVGSARRYVASPDVGVLVGRQ